MESNSLEKKIWDMKQDFRQHHAEKPISQAITILENSLDALKHTLEQRRTNKLDKLLKEKAEMQPLNRHPRIRAPPIPEHDTNPRTVVNLSDIVLSDPDKDYSQKD